MADRNTYLTYKRDQSRLVHWILQTSAEIIQQHPSEAATAINSTGVVSLTTLQSLSALIAKDPYPIPATIFRLFESIIDARKKTHDIFLKVATSAQESKIQNGNESHKHWIDGLTIAFHALGGKPWEAGKTSHGDAPDEDEEKVIFTNKFSTLSPDNNTKAEDQEGMTAHGSDDGVTDVAAQASFDTPTMRPKRKPHKKRKHGKKGKNPKSESTAADSADPSKLQAVVREPSDY
ncbi:hypothetical protein N7541_002459 [Penicillium brevicompactum]|uniref:DUF6604 domain-containing protein n=1 Tax=Penicillium brevicompactum TaxID=5074 RepID=A0A9W9V061_PENBR|nr:hypothetical protein N7541_002459 [Penicillium brevicompactum]